MLRVGLIGLAGALGTLARYWASTAAPKLLGAGFPYGTLFVNIVGSFVLAVVMYLGTQANVMDATTRMTLGTGFCGGFTTYSTFNYETMRYLQEDAWLLAGVNIVVTLITCMLAALGGWWLAQLVWGRS